MKYCIIYITFASIDEAKKIAHILLQQKLVACANIMPPITSMYEWEGKIQEETEILGIFKTTENKFKMVENKVSELHSYEVPCIIMLPILNGEKKYLKWIENSV
jgi:periplasmic divalent cation tolerance protein